MKNNGGPAFPIPATEYHGMDSGITLRDYFAAKAMQGWLASYSGEESHPVTSGYEDVVARNAYRMADAMLKAREVT